MPASSSGGGGSPPPRSPRIMKRELAFALQSLSASPASPGRTRSGRLIANAPVPGGKRRRRSEPDKDKYKEKEKEKEQERPDLVSPATPPMDAEAPKPKQPIPDADLMDVASFAAMEDVGAGASGRDGSDRGEEATLQELDGGVAKEAPLVVEEGTARMDTCYRSNGGGDLQQSVVATGDVPNGLGVAVSEEEDKGMEACDGAVAEEDKEMDACDGAVTKEDDKQMDVCDDAVANDGKQMDVCDGADVVPDLQGPADAVVKEAADAVVKVASLVAGDNAAVDVTAERPTRRFTRSLLKNKPEEDSGGLDKAVSAPVEAKGASVDSVQPEKPVRRFTRSLLKAKADTSHSSGSVGSDETMDSTSDSASVKKMEMKMSKKVACLTKPPVNVRELLSTGLLEGMRVVYVIPHSKRDVLKGVIAGCNVRCFCLYCNGSKAISSYHFEQHAGSNKKHPSHYIYLENGNSLRDVLRESENSPLDTLEKTIRSSIDPMAKKRNSTCLNCSESLPPSQAESFLCHSCLELKQPQDPPSPSHPCGSNPSLTSYSKGSSLKKISSNKKSASAGRLTTKDIGLHKLVFKVLLDGTEVAYYVDGKRKIDGYIKDQRIFCNHCNKVVSPSAFEAHAGEGTRRKPYDNIFTSNGVSLHELSMKISMNMTQSERETDDLCGECGEGGDIFPCKICPRSFHAACVGLAEVPSEWYCDNCSNHVQKEKTLAENKNAKAAGRQAGVDSIEQIMKRAIRIVPVSDDLGGCALCKQKDFNNSVFDERTVILCDQCEKEYHVGCLRSQCQVDLKELPEGEWFCCSSCSEIRSSLDEIISRGAELLPESDIDIIRKKCEMRGLTMDANMDIRWRLLAGRRASEDSNLLLSAAVPIIHESFDPIIEAHTGRDLIPEMVNGRRPKDGMPGQDYSGMYCALLTVGSSVVSAGLLRVMGGELAELPLVATSREFQGLGYFQVLFSRIEKMLVSLKIKHFMLPAAQEAEAIWTKKFGFSRIPQEQLEACLNGAHLTIFHGTSNLYKAVPLS